jgi:hypothetical protein
LPLAETALRWSHEAGRRHVAGARPSGAIAICPSHEIALAPSREIAGVVAESDVGRQGRPVTWPVSRGTDGIAWIEPAGAWR